MVETGGTRSSTRTYSYLRAYIKRQGYLARLLNNDPTQRLGANRAAEVKGHPFFHDVNWHECAQRNYATPFKPHDAATVFWRESHTYQPFKCPVREKRESQGKIYEQIGTAKFPLWLPVGRVNDKSKTRL
ncbi:hypothetical protein BDV26DRAFT_252467 [Aspergillus bertholletiae]|uniref:AGC-kinase C-terminal domain-containing protein n=1 Tax=Aspergillus bertholletiae TaxID=1226010 RepID=A0A5N7BMW3_9EURO|nr:hypothetical protein BDV26DRAFT_252467 [Aspergillus bertholletiae]